MKLNNVPNLKNQDNNLLIKKMALIAILTAIYLVFCSFIRIPFGGGNYIEITDILLFASLMIIPKYWVIIPSISGCALSDIISGSLNYSIATVLAKAVVGLILLLAIQKNVKWMIICSIIIAQVLSIFIYFTWDFFVIWQSVSKSIQNLVYNSIQGGIVISGSIFLAFFFFKTKKNETINNYFIT